MKVFLCEPIHPDALELLKSRAEIISDWDRIGEADAIINRNLQLPEEVLKKAPSLKVVAVHGTGSDGIDLEYCEKHGIVITYVPRENANSVAELIVTLALCALRKIALADRMVNAGSVKVSGPEELMGRELSGKTLGLIGVGDIAMRVARMMKAAFGVSIIGYDPFFQEERAAEIGIRRVGTPEEIFREADVINISVHLTESTANMVNAERLALCKPTAVLVNASRGGVVDEAALYEALKNGRPGAAACDVWLHEPPTKDNPLIGLDNLLATPHLGANTDEALRRVGIRMVQDIFTVMDGGKAENTYSFSGNRTN